MTKINADWIEREETQGVCAALEAAGHRILFVGGCIRNALIDEPVNDIDLATDAPPEATMRAAEAAGLRAVPTGIDHGTVTIVSRGLAHEVTTFRRDVETTGRHAVVAFTDQIEEDARRRDFTMNALYADRTGAVIDPLDGLADLKSRRVRFIEDAQARICEDYLRILRFFRFHAWYGAPEEGLDADGLAACAENADGLEVLSKERVGAEMLKLLAAKDPAPATAAMSAAGCLHPILPGADLKSLPILVHMEKGADQKPDAIRRLAVLGGQNVAENLRLSKAETRRLDAIRSVALDSMPLAEMGYRNGMRIGVDAVLLRAALSETPAPNDFENQVQEGANATFPIKSADLIDTYQGVALGAKLRELETKWINSGFNATRRELLVSDM